MLRNIALSAGMTALLLATPAFAHHPSGAGSALGAGPIIERWSGFVSVGVPILNDLNGVQAEPDWRLLTGVAVNF